MKLCPKCNKQFSDDANFCPVDAARLSPIEVPAAGPDALAAKYDLGPRLGGSRTGAVHRATDTASGKACVIKLIAPAVGLVSPTGGASPRWRSRPPRAQRRVNARSTR